MSRRACVHTCDGCQRSSTAIAHKLSREVHRHQLRLQHNGRAAARGVLVRCSLSPAHSVTQGPRVTAVGAAAVGAAARTERTRARSRRCSRMHLANTSRPRNKADAAAQQAHTFPHCSHAIGCVEGLEAAHAPHVTHGAPHRRVVAAPHAALWASGKGCRQHRGGREGGVQG